MDEIEKMEWKDDYSIGVPEIDAQHKKLVEIMGKLYSILTDNASNYRNGIRSVVEELAKYTDYHFKCEENDYFDKYGYPSAEIHVMQHDNFISQVTDRLKNLDRMTLEDGKVFYSYLKAWLLNHIALADKSWAVFIAPKLPKK